MVLLVFSSSDAPFNRFTGIISFKAGHTHLLTGNGIEIVRALLESSRDRQYETKYRTQSRAQEGKEDKMTTHDKHST